MDQLLIITNNCTACRACEIACHFHHTTRFGTSRSSIYIDYNEDTSELEIIFDETCDSCAGLTVPHCVNCCIPGAIQLKDAVGAIKGASHE